jgi:nucleoside-diphosphate-sugar epimerase
VTTYEQPRAVDPEDRTGPSSGAEINAQSSYNYATVSPVAGTASGGLAGPAHVEGRPGVVLVTGAAGFVGSAAVRALAGTGPLRLLLHRSPVPATVTPPAGTDIRYGDLGEPASIEGICDGVRTVVHLANLVSEDERRCRAVNEFGTGALLAQAHRAGVHRVVYLSTSGVYGNASYSAAVESDLPTTPVSATSRSRLRAEELVRAYGGVVLRPHLVYGTGDRYAVPGLIWMLRTIGGLPDGGHCLQSVIDVDDLARIVAALARQDWGPGPAQVYHACHPEPVSLAALAATVVAALGLDLALHPVPLAEAGQRLRAVGIAQRELVRICQSHWCDATSVWRRVGLDPGPPLVTGLVRHARWYGGTQSGPQPGQSGAGVHPHGRSAGRHPVLGPAGFGPPFGFGSPAGRGFDGRDDDERTVRLSP